MTEFKTGDRVRYCADEDARGTVIGVLDGKVWVLWDSGVVLAYWPHELRLLPAPLPTLWANLWDDSIGISCESREQADHLATLTQTNGRIGVIEVGDHLPGGVKLHDLRDGGK